MIQFLTNDSILKEEDVLERSKALSIADRLVNKSFQSK